MSNGKKIDYSGVMIVLIFVAAILALSGINSFDLAESYSEDKVIETPSGPQNQIVKTLTEIDAELMSFFGELREVIDYLFE